MGYRVISYSLWGIEVLLKVPVIIMKFGENNALGTIHISIYINFGMLVGEGYIWYTLHVFVYYS